MARSFAADVSIAISTSTKDKSEAAGGTAPCGVIFWSQRCLPRVPRELFEPETVVVALAFFLVRLDLSFNRLDQIPAEIGRFTALQELYVNDNPRLQSLPNELANCQALRVLDASTTALASLPSEIGVLQNLRVLAIEETPLEKKLRSKQVLPPLPFSPEFVSFVEEYVVPAPEDASNPDKSQEATPCQRILRELRRKDERVRLKNELRDKLSFDTYRLDRSNSEVIGHVAAAVRRVVKQFPLSSDFRSFVRNAERFFPGEFSHTALARMDALATRKAFDALAQENERKKLAADLELKLRAIYFDRVEPPVIENMVSQIYAHVPALTDVKFLIKHAAVLLPPEPKDVDGTTVQLKIVERQRQLASERQAAVDKLHAAVKAIYSDTEPDQIQSLVALVAALFKVMFV